MHHNQRILFGTTELSAELNDYLSGTVTPGITAGDPIYIGQEAPFNNLWIDVTTPNAVDAVLSISLWSANEWQDAVDIYDGTASSSGKALAQDGRVTFSPRWDRSWDFQDRSSLVTGLEDTEMYNLYWARLTYSATLTGSTTLAYVGQKFSNDTDLAAFYPDLRNQVLRTAWAGSSSKTDWQDQHYSAAQVILADLKTRRIIVAPGQVMDWTIFRIPAVHKVAEMIYAGLGPAYAPHMERAGKAYQGALAMEYFRTDKNLDGHLSPKERTLNVSYMKR